MHRTTHSAYDFIRTVGAWAAQNVGRRMMSERLDGHSGPAEQVVVKRELLVQLDTLACHAVDSHLRVDILNLTSIMR